MELRNITLDDLALYEAIHCDPAMMSELGGPLPREGMAEKLREDIRWVARGKAWIFKIMPDDEPETPAGTVVVWEHDWRDEVINEIGWMVLPRFQGRGLGSTAVRTMLERARAEGRWGVVHAFPPTSNERSNAMCRRMGFSLIEEVDIEYRERPLHCNHWVLDLRSGGEAAAQQNS